MLKSSQLQCKFFIIVAICILVIHAQNVYADSKKTELTTKSSQFNKEKILSKAFCRLYNMKFELVLTSPSGDVLEDDISLWFVQSGNAVKANPGKPGYIAFFTDRSKSTSICKAVTVFELSKGYLAVPLFVSNRPGLDLLSVTVYSPQNNSVLEYVVLESYFGVHPKFRAIKGGFSYLAVSAQPNDGPEGMVETWLDVTWSGKQLIKKWDRTHPEVRH